MIDIILNQYGPIIILITFLSIALFLIGTVRIMRTQTQPLSEKSGQKPVPLHITSKDIEAIAGNDIIATQLDLARAYIETGRKQLAKKILDHVCKHGDSKQQREADFLLKKFVKQLTIPARDQV